MSDKNLYKLTRGQWRRFEPDGKGGGESVRYAPGEIIANLTKLEIAEHGSKLALVSQADLDRQAEADAKLKAILKPAVAPEGAESEDDYDWTEVLAGSVSTVKEYINDILTDPVMVDSLMRAEMEGQNRKGVVSEANDRLAQLAKTPKG